MHWYWWMAIGIYELIAVGVFVFMVGMSGFNPDGGIHTISGYLGTALVAEFWPLIPVLMWLVGKF